MTKNPSKTLNDLSSEIHDGFFKYARVFFSKIVIIAINISEMRQRGRFAGFSLYTSNSGNTGDLRNSSLCYMDGPTLPPLNFTTTCIISGRYIVFYNERLDGIKYPAGYETSSTVYTELCEVQVYGKQPVCFIIPPRKRSCGA